MKSAIKLHRFLLISILLIILIFPISACQSKNTPSTTRTVSITDMAGRNIDIPASIDKIYCYDPGSAILLYHVAPEQLLGWTYPFNDYEASYILAEYQNLPVYGENTNDEAIVSAKPTLALISGSPNDSLIEKADALQNRIGIPVIILDLNLMELPDAYALLGEVTGNTEQSSALSAYAQRVLESIVEIPEDERKTIYYANGIDSLNTSAKGTAASLIFDMVYAENVCDMQSDSGNRIQVTKEHLLTWDPQYIFVNGEPQSNLSGSSASRALLDDPQYANLQAVISGNVYSIPKSPFAWLDRPRSGNRLIGIRWLGSILYPDSYEFNNDDIKEFYQLFYHMDLTDDQVEALLKQ